MAYRPAHTAPRKFPRREGRRPAKRDHRVHWLAVQWGDENMKLADGTTSCGLAYDGPGRSPLKLARVDEEVTCKDCLTIHAKNREKDRAFLDSLKPVI